MASQPLAVTGNLYLQDLVRFVDANSAFILDSTRTLKLNTCGLHYVHSHLEILEELEHLLAGSPINYLCDYVSDVGDFRPLEQLRRILKLVTEVRVVSVLRNSKGRDPTRVCLGGVFGRLRSLELRGCDLSAAEAKGLLELRGTLERLVCYNSTDALWHVFASQIAEIKNSQDSNTLDLSRNNFTKLENLRKCFKLKYLDLGFNHLQNISLFNVELSMLGSHTVKEVAEVTVGRGFQVVRVCISSRARYLFIIKNMENSRQLFEILQFIDGPMCRCSLKSVGQAQVELFRRHVWGSTKVGILQILNSSVLAQQ